MAYRTNDATVRATIRIAQTTPTAIFILMANSLTNQVALNDVYGQLDANTLLGIETLLACHYIASHPDEQQYASRTTEGASATFQGQTTQVLKATTYGQNAMMLDVTNYLARHSKEVEDGYKRVASIVYLGEACETTQELLQLGDGPED